MKKFETKLRVRYGETDQMGYVYYGNYAQFFEVARVELMRELGMSYKELESQGYMLPVAEMSTRYYKPAFYDDLLTIKTSIPEIPSITIKFDYEIYNEEGVLLNKAKTTLVFVDMKTGKTTRAPELLKKEVSKLML